MWKLWIVASLCDNCKKCEEIIPWLLSQNDMTIYINMARANADELLDNAKEVIGICPQNAAKLREAGR